MRTRSRLRLFGILSVSAAIAIAFWLLLPLTEAQDNQKVSNKEDEQIVERPILDNPDDILLNAGTVNVKAEKAKGSGDEKDSLNAREYGGERLHLVRFNGPIKSSWVESLKAANLEIVDYIPHYTYLVWGDLFAVENIRSAAKSGTSPVEW